MMVHEKFKWVILLLIACGSASLCAGELSDRYILARMINCGYMEKVDPAAGETTESKIRKIVLSFSELKSSPATVEEIVNAYADPMSSDTAAWASSLKPQTKIISSFEDAAKSQLSKSGGYVILDPQLREFRLHLSPFYVTALGRMSLAPFDDSLTTYVAAGLSKSLTDNDKREAREKIIEGLSREPGPLNPGVDLLCIAYLNQTADVDFMDELWDTFPVYHSSLLLHAAFAVSGSPLVNWGLDRVDQVRKSAAHHSDYPPDQHYQYLLSMIIQNHIRHPRAYAIAKSVVRNPGVFFPYRNHMLYSLRTIEKAYPIDEVLRQVEDEMEMTSAVLNMALP